MKTNRFATLSVRKELTVCLLLSLLWCIAPCAQDRTGSTATDNGLATLRSWKAGQTVDEESVSRFGEEKCFTSETIDDLTFSRMYGKSYKKDCTVPRSDLRLLKVLHRDYNSNIRLGELVCHKSISADLLDIFKTLYRVGYPIERMTLVDDYNADDEASMAANNTSCFNYRSIAGAKKLSLHSQGKAIDINPRYNPCVKKRRDGSTTVSPKNGKPYADRTKRFTYKITQGDLCYKEFIRHGFKWGGAWKSLKDYQHFEKP